ncbi:endonuclease/exonuclease/phosphatase family protein [Pedobacter arcticus]|uniref:endonuclease/exonuclease/phosphatase family protein n=1 Tax=Pedobacter arcticus TaxID=752140 RepID=UPI000366115B|nr:endonuclease/exonuclease/phosphatase family protein [Pedobacter arcticus]
MDLALSVVSYLCVAFVVLPMVKSDFWIFRSLEYSRFQNFLLCVVLVVLWLIDGLIFSGEINWLPAVLNFVCMVYLAVKISPYTTIRKKEVLDIKNRNTDRELKLVNANVLQTNKAYSNLIGQIQETNPDLVLLLETDRDWQQATQVLKQDYPHTVEVPQSNTYGMLLYSKLELEEAKIEFLVKNDIPSITAKIVLPSGEKVKLWCLHPEPPVPGESLTSTAKDKELSIVALKVKESELPVIVMGDLNDVAWSDTTSLFTKTSKLLDVRKGRGFYSTFSAHHWFIRFPLDYIFCSSNFGFVAMKRLKKNGSDHFPIFTHLMLDESLKPVQQKAHPDADVIDEAKEKASQAV